MFQRIRLGWARSSVVLGCCGLLAAVLLIGCCETWVKIGAVVGGTPPTRLDIKDTPPDIWVCPGTPVTIEWAASDDVNSATVTDVTNVNLPTGYRTVTPHSTTTYTITGRGECERTDSITVNVITAGMQGDLTASRVDVKRTFYWGVKADKNFWDPNILITSIRFVAFTDKGWENVRPLRVQKTDIDGTMHDFPLDTSFSTPPAFPIPVAGDWQIVLGPGVVAPNNPPQYVTLEFKVKCKGQ